jgi:hypothetical protein
LPVTNATSVNAGRVVLGHKRKRWDLPSLKTLVEELKKHTVIFKAAPAGPCPYDGCNFYHHDKTTDQLFVHMINAHAEPGTPPLFPEDMGYKCRS